MSEKDKDVDPVVVDQKVGSVVAEEVAPEDQIRQRQLEERMAQNLADRQPQSNGSEEFSEEDQISACRTFYDDLRTEADIIEKKDLNFDCLEKSSISYFIKNELFKYQPSDDEINNEGNRFTNGDLQKPIFLNILKKLV